MGNFEIEIFEIMLASAFDHDGILHRPRVYHKEQESRDLPVNKIIDPPVRGHIQSFFDFQDKKTDTTRLRLFPFPLLFSVSRGIS